jgi:hypothetical protein
MRAVIDSAALSQAPRRIWDEGRGNPVGWIVRTGLGAFESDDRTLWRTADDVYSAELRRSRNGRQVYLALLAGGTYLGCCDADGWRPASRRSRIRHLRSPQLPLSPPGRLNGEGRPAVAVRSSGRPDRLQRRRHESVVARGLRPRACTPASDGCPDLRRRTRLPRDRGLWPPLGREDQGRVRASGHRTHRGFVSARGCRAGEARLFLISLDRMLIWARRSQPAIHVASRRSARDRSWRGDRTYTASSSKGWGGSRPARDQSRRSGT